MSTRQFKFKLVLSSGKYKFAHGADEDDAIANFVFFGGNSDDVVDVIPCFNPAKQRKKIDWDG